MGCRAYQSTFLNGQTLTITGVGSGQISGAFTHANTALVTESGIASPLN